MLLQQRLMVNRSIPTVIESRRKHAMAEAHRKNWRDLCNAALKAKDPDELLKIVQELNRALKREEQVRRDFREAVRANEAPEESDVSDGAWPAQSHTSMESGRGVGSPRSNDLRGAERIDWAFREIPPRQEQPDGVRAFPITQERRQ
jgi:hypothetical protein